MKKSFLRDLSGNFAVTFAVMIVPLMGAIGLATDYASMYSAQSELQEVADAAALAATRELALSTTTKSDVVSVAENFVSTQFSIEKAESEYVEVSTSVSDDKSEVTVDLAYYWQPFLAQYMNDRVLPLRVRAVAARAGSEAVCVIVTQPSEDERLLFTGAASIVADRCAVHVSSTDREAIVVNKRAVLKASNIYSGGGYVGVSGSFSPQPIVDAPPIEDPLADRNPPASGSCDHTDMMINDGMSATLYPGTYCGGLMIAKGAKVFLKPGVYVMRDGPLWTIGLTEIVGENVGFYFEGDTAVFDIGLDSVISLTAPKSGPLAGILMFEDRNAPINRTFTMRSKNAEKMEGVIYLPNGKLFVDKASRVGQTSKWSAIIARQLEIGNGPQIQINSDYGGSTVPVPAGVKGTSNRVYLTN